MLRLNPAFTLVSILSLALGIGANAAIFQLIDAVRMRVLAVKDPQQLAIVRIADRHWNSGHFEGRVPKAEQDSLLISSIVFGGYNRPFQCH